MSIFTTTREKSPLHIEKRPVTLIPPIRLKIQDVEKALQAECNRDRRLQKTQNLQPNLNLMKLTTRLDWLPIFDSSHQENDSATEDKTDNLDHQLNRISLKRLQPISLFETSKRKVQKTAHDSTDIVLDKQRYLPLFQQSEKWQRGISTPIDQEKDKSLVVLQQSLTESPNENQSQQQQPQQQKRPPPPPPPQQQQRQQQILEQQEQQEQQEPQAAIDILEEVLGETDYNARSRIIVPAMKKRGSLSSSTSTRPLSLSTSSSSRSPPPAPSSEPSTSTEARPVVTNVGPVPVATATTIPTTASTAAAAATTAATLASVVSVATTTSSSTESRPAQTSKSLVTNSTSTTDTPLPNHSDSHFDTILRQNIPVFGTTLQCQAIKKEIGRLASFSTSFLKHHVGKVLDILNHPLIALIPDYVESEDSLWHGSGKTLFLQQLLTRLEERSQIIHLAIVCYDLNTEEFLMKLIKPRFKVQRLNTVKDDEWDQEYGVIVRIKKPHTNSPKSTFDCKVDLAIIMDIRIQPTDPVMTMFQSTTSSGPPPIVSLVTNRSVELRLQDYISKSSSPPKWHIPDQTSCASIFDTKNDTAVENNGLLTFMVVDSVIRWIDSGMKTIYQFANNQNATPPSPQMDTDHQQSSTLSPIEKHQQKNATNTTDKAATVPVRSKSPTRQNRTLGPEETASTSIAEITGDEAIPSLQDDLANLFTHVSLERLQNDLKSYKSYQGKSSNQHYTARSDDEDSFYSAKSDSLSDDNTYSKVQAVIDSLQDTFTDFSKTAQSSDMLKSMKAEFDKKCLGIFQAMVVSYQNSVMELQKEYATEAEKKLGLLSTSTGTDSSS